MSATDPADDPAAAGDPDEPDGADGHRAFWADAVADEIEARDPAEPIVIKGGVSPSGVAHLGNLNEIVRGYFVAAVLRERGHEVRQVFTSDDRDPLRKLPRTLADREGNFVDLGDVDAAALGRNLGRPYSDVPDPFGEADSYAAHFARLLAADADRLAIPVETASNTDLYGEGAFEPATERLLSDLEAARAVLGRYQDRVDDAYVPFNPICADCGRVTETVTAVDVAAGTVDYRCTGMTAGGREIEGCGHEGTATLREGKLPWRFEWPAQWDVLDVDHEPFGKDHAEGSWPSGEEIARELLGVEPPVPMTYEWFTLNGEPLSSSAGNVVTVREALEFLEPEVLRYFFALDPRKARDFDLARLDRLVDDFDRFEAVYFSDAEPGGDREQAFAERAYPFVVDEVPDGHLRVPYTFAAVLGMTDDRELRLEMARREGHLPADAPDWAIEAAMDRVERARRWAERTDNEYNYRLQADCPSVELGEDVPAALDELAEYVEAGLDADALQGEIYETAKRHDLPVDDLFEAGYELFLGQPDGPRLGPFLAALDDEFVVGRLRRES